MNEPMRQGESMARAKAAASTPWPRTYRIVVEGKLDDTWSERLAGMRLDSTRKSEAGSATTVLQGKLRDQAELSGVVNTLCDLQLPLLEMEII